MLRTFHSHHLKCPPLLLLALKGHSHAILVHFKNKKICPHINEGPQIMV